MAEETEKRDMTVAEAGRKGGRVVLETYGKEFYAEIGTKGGATTKNRYGSEHYSAIGAIGGRATSEKYGSDFYEKIGRAGGARVRQLIQAAKEAEAKADAE